MNLRNGSYQRQSKPRAALLAGAGVVHPEEGLKDLLAEFCRNSGPLVSDLHPEDAVRLPAGNRTDPPVGLYLTAFSSRLNTAR